MYVLEALITTLESTSGGTKDGAGPGTAKFRFNFIPSGDFDIHAVITSAVTS